MDDQVSDQGSRDVLRVAAVTAAAAVATVADCVSAGVTLGDPSDASTDHIGSDHRAVASHLRQLDRGDGPTIDASRSGESVYCDDLAADPRWPGWSPGAQRDGFTAVVVLPLSTGRVTLGHLTLYAEVEQAFPIHDTPRTLSFVEHAAVALNAATGVDRRDREIDRLTTVGQAQGMIMERFGVTPASAFAMLERASHRRGIMPHRLAEEVVTAGVDDALARDADLV